MDFARHYIMFGLFLLMHDLLEKPPAAKSEGVRGKRPLTSLKSGEFRG